MVANFANMRPHVKAVVFTLVTVAGPLLGVPDAAGQVARPPTSEAAQRLEHERNTIRVFKNAVRTTVFVTQKRHIRDYWSRRTTEVEAGTGSGFVWDQKGHIVTNYHVIADGSSFVVRFQDGSEVPATLIGGDKNKDVAILRIKKRGTRLTAIPLPHPGSALEVGQTTIAIGNPFGLDHTLTVGVVSAINREVKGYGGVTIRGMVQTDASINPGNSGGPLLNSSGELIGMNTMIFSKAGQSAGIGFAVPVATLRRVVPQIIEFGAPRQVGLGIEIVSDTLARRSGIEGVVISSVPRQSPARRAGLKGLTRTRRGTFVGDVIVAIDGTQISSYDDYYGILDGRSPGDSVSVTVTNEGKKRTVRTKLMLVR